MFMVGNVSKPKPTDNVTQVGSFTRVFIDSVRKTGGTIEKGSFCKPSKTHC